MVNSNLVSVRRDGSTEVHKIGDFYRIFGSARTVVPEFAAVEYLAHIGAKTAPLLGASRAGESASYDLGELKGQSFSARFATEKPLSDWLRKYAHEVALFAKAQASIVCPDAHADPTVVLRAIHFDELFARFSDRAKQLHEVRDKIQKAIGALPSTLCHGDFGGSNLFADGSIDFENVFWGPLGYDALSAASNFLWYPTKNTAPNAERHRPWEISARDVRTILDAVCSELEASVARNLKEFTNELILMRGCWYLGAMRGRPELESWRTRRMEQALDAYAGKQDVLLALTGNEPKAKQKNQPVSLMGSERVLILGAGAATRDHHLPNVTALNPSRIEVRDINPDALKRIGRPGILTTQVDACVAQASTESRALRDKTVVLIATPMKCEPLHHVLEAGYRRILIEKPIASTGDEAREMRRLLEQYSDAKLFLLESYCTKFLPLAYLCGGIAARDPRTRWIGQAQRSAVDPSLRGQLNEMIGPIKSIDAKVVEGGRWGFPDLESIPYLLGDKQNGGMLLCLFPHALHPLLDCETIDLATIAVSDVELHRLEKDQAGRLKHEWLPVTDASQIEARAKVVLSASGKRTAGSIPVRIEVAKTWERDDWDSWKTTIVGERGRVEFCTRRGGRLKVFEQGNLDPTVELYLAGDPYRLGLQEGYAYLCGNIRGNGRVAHGLGIVEIIDSIKTFAYRK